MSVTPTTSYDGSYVVRWTDYSGGTTWRAYLLESYDGGAWTRTAVTGSQSRSFTGRALGTYSYLVEIWEYDPELRRQYFDHETNVATVSVVPLAPPQTPLALTGPATSSSGSYTISWSAPAGPPVTRYELFENGVLVYADAARSAAISGKTNGAYSYVVRGCNAAGCGPGTAPLAVTVLFVPSAPGPVAGPSSSGTGSYALSWGAASGSVTRYELVENGVVAYGGTALTAALSGRSSGTYSYVARACNASGCGPGTAAFSVTVLLPPGAPGAITGPASSTTGSYTLAWGAAAGTVIRYELLENGSVAYAGPYRNASLSVNANGTYSYVARACNSSGCGPGTAPHVVAVTLPLTMTLPDSPLVQLTVPPQAQVGAVPGTPATDGGSARYTIPIEVPPGRAGMQPEVALVYGSRNGNGIAGVGWSLSATRSIYRCPRTLRQDGASAPVRHGPEDRLCFNGQRLVTAATTVAGYGRSGSEYRTEVDEFARITLLGGDVDPWGSYFQIEHKSGRVSFYKPLTLAAQTRAPDSWYLDHERDPQGNCVRYAYSRFSERGNGEDEEWVLASIGYTGSADPNAPACSLPAGARRVDFEYTADREDKRTTYAYGVASMMTARLAAIRTSVGATPVRRYDLTYERSIATGRSLLQGVALCGGGSCSAGVAPTAFSYQGWQAGFSFGGGGNTNVGLVGDYDGDGKRDLLSYAPTGSYLTLSGVGADQAHLVQAISQEMLQSAGFAAPGPVAWHPVDANNDGKSDLLGAAKPAGAATPLLALGSWTSAGWQVQLTNVPLPADRANGLPGSTQRGLDYDGDGLLDAGVTDYTTSQTTYYRGFDVRSSVAAPPVTTEESHFTVDVNGDGRTDTIFDARWEQQAYDPRVAFLTDQLKYENWYLNCGSAACVVGVVSGSFGGASLGGPAGSLKGPAGSENERRRWIDVNGDGLRDIYERGAVYVNRGGPPRNGMFRRAAVAYPVILHEYDRFAFVMDVDADGADELVVPTTRRYDYCESKPDPGSEDNGYITLCAGSGANRLSVESDRSVFFTAAYKFRENADGSFELIPAGDGPSAPLQGVETAIQDWNGDGMDDLSFQLWSDDLTQLGGSGYPDLGSGLYLSRNDAPAPDLLVSVTNGLGSTSSWSHQPLSARTVQACALPANGAFYTVDHGRDRSRGYVFFTSSMWAVSRFETDHGLALTVPPRKTCYRYEDAMLDVEGRGFQGFKKIVVEEQSPPAAGEPPGVALQPSGVLVSANNLRTTTEFLQEFPYTNRILRVAVERAADGAPLSETTHAWTVAQNASGALVVYPGKTVDKAFDPDTRARLATTVSILADVDPESGDARNSCAFTEDAAAQATHASWAERPLPKVDDLPLEPHAIRISRETRDIVNDTTADVWWPGKVLSVTKLTDFVDATQLPHEDAVTCPTGPITGSSPRAKEMRTDYGWYGASTAQGYQRKLESEALSSREVTEATTTYAEYDSNGNVVQSQVTARGVTGTLTTRYGYDADGYFRKTETNPVGHQSTTTIDPATGLVLTRQAVQGGPRTTTVYDGLGRVLQVTTDGEPPVYERLLSCEGCAIARQVLQAGAPTTTEYLDRLGRVVSTTTEGLDGTPIVTAVEYNERGLKTAEHAPRYATATATYRTLYSGFDALGRVGTKTVERDPSLFAAGGTGAPTLTTRYAYSGFTTSITVERPVGQSPLRMSRTTNAAGKLIETTQDVTTPLKGAPPGSPGTPHTILTRYLYDPAGSVTHIVDTDRNVIVAGYDDLGRKTRVDDPDRGTWTWEWDGLGRVTKQTDARGVYTRSEHDGAGRLERRFVKAPADLQEMLEASWYYDPEEFPGGPRQWGVVSRVEGSDGFIREYAYDALLRPEKVTTKLPASDAIQTSGVRAFEMEYAYDRNYGRQKGVRYPDGVIVGLDYGARGHLVGETEISIPTGTPGKQYRHVSSMSPRGQITEQLLGNCVSEDAQYDASTGMALFLATHRPTPAVPSTWTVPQRLADCPPRNPVAELDPSRLIRQAEYRYDHLLNLKQQKKNIAGSEATETFEYDDLQRLVSASRSWGLPTADETDRYTYDDLGNITSKSDYASLYSYGGASPEAGFAGPHAITAAAKTDNTTATFSYDANGNMESGDGRTVLFDRLDRPVRVVQGDVTTDFAYAPDGARYRQTTTGPSSPAFGPKTVYYVDKDYELTVWTQSPPLVEARTYVSKSLVLFRSGALPLRQRYVHLDRLGSVEAVTFTVPETTEFMADAHGYDPFGKPRGRTWAASGERLHPAGDLGVTTDRGFTGHEHLDNLYLIHMNGRVYDYRLGRFLSVDPFIADLADSQAINPYSYIGNNPLSGVDPTGYKPEVYRSLYDRLFSGRSSGEFELEFPTGDPIGVRSVIALRMGSTGSGGGSDPSSEEANPVDHGSPRETATSNLTLGNWANRLHLDAIAETGAQVLQDSVIGAAKELANTINGFRNAVNAPFDFILSELGSDVRFPPLPALTPSTQGEASAMAAVYIGGLALGRARAAPAKALRPLPLLDRTGKVHGALPKASELGRYSVDDLTRLQAELRQSVQQRIRRTIQLGPDKAHGQRQAAEQELIRQIEKHLEGRR